MARMNVYLPDDLAAAARQSGLNLSAVTQEAVRATLAARSTDAWLAMLAATAAPESTAPAPATPGSVPHDRALEALDAARDEPSTHHV